MRSKWFKLKNKAIRLRKKGCSIKDVEKQLGIPRSTLSGWFKDIKLTKKQKNILEDRWKNALVKARKEAVKWHNKQKRERLKQAQTEAQAVLKNVNINNKDIVELSLSMLYLGEGSKSLNTSLGNTKPLVLNYYIKCLDLIYGIKKNQLKYELHLRSDQVIDKEIEYWSKVLEAPIENFRGYKDKRKAKKKTYPHYHGVCIVYGGGYKILRRLNFLSEQFCYKITKKEGPLAQLV